MMHGQITGQTGLEPGRSVRCVALLVDGENISADFAGQVIVGAARLGALVVKRIYGNAAQLPKWNAAPGFRLIHSGSGKNATDLLLSIEAVSLCHEAKIDTVVIASSDRDFSHLAHHLRERGIAVFGIGEANAPEAFRKACERFIELAPRVVAVPPKSKPMVAACPIEAALDALIRNEGTKDGYAMAALGGRMHALHKLRIKDQPEKTWRAFLLKRSHRYACDAKGPTARVRLVQSATP